LGCCSNPAYEKVFLKATPSTRKESETDPPFTVFTPIKFKSSRWESRDNTASTTIGPNNSFWEEMSLEFKAVLAHFSNASLVVKNDHKKSKKSNLREGADSFLLSSGSSPNVTDKVEICPIASLQAFLSPLMIT